MPRRPLTDTQRNIGSRRRATIQILAAKRLTTDAEQAAKRATVSAITGAEIARARGRAQAAVERQKGLYGAARQERVTRTALSIPGNVAGTAAPGIGSTLFLIGSFMAILIIFYLLVDKAQKTSGFLGGLGVALSKLSSIDPLFTKVETGSTS